MDSKTTSSTNKLIIDLDRLDASHILKDEEYIRKDIIDNMEDTIRRVVMENSSAINYYNNRYNFDDLDSNIPLAQHPCFFIHGERGSGKSTLLRGLSHRLTHNNRQESSSSSKEVNATIQLLAQVDPTEFAEKESFFIYILSRIAEKLKKIGSQSRSAYDDSHKGDYKAALKIIREMSHGLKMLYDTEDSLRKSEDPSFFIEDSISKCASSADLKKKFYELLEKLSRLCHCDAFLVTIDDADLNFSKCSEIMETVRKYMINPYIIFVFAGNLDLYSLIVRSMQLNQFSTKVLAYEPSRSSHRDILIDKYEDQYMSKLIPAQNRTYMSGSSSILNHGLMRNIFLKHHNKTIPLADYMHMCISLLYPFTVRKDIYNLLVTIPVRSILQLLRLWVASIPYMTTNVGAYLRREYKIVFEKLADGIQKVFCQPLIQHHVNFIDINNPNELFKEILFHVAELDFLPGSSKLTSVIGKQSLRIVSFYLNAKSAQYMSSVRQVLSYYLFVHTNIYYTQQTIKHTALSYDNITQIAKHQLYREKITNAYYLANELDSMMNCPWHTAFYIKSEEMRSAKHFSFGKGIVCLCRLGDNNGCEKFETFIDSLKLTNSNTKTLSKKETFCNFIYAIYNSICIISTDKGTAYYLSIYSILKLIVDLLYIEGIFKAENLQQFVSNRTKIMKPFASLQIDETYDYKNVKEVVIHKQTISQHFVDISRKDSTEHKKLIDSMEKWVKTVKKEIILCYPVSLDNTWHNFIERCDNIFDTLTENHTKSVGVGELFKHYLIQFEEALSNIYSSEKNPIYKCIKSFPLWQALTDGKIEKFALWQKINEITIIPNEKINTTRSSDNENTNSSAM